MSQYFPKPYEPFGGDINVKVDLPNYETKTDIKNISHVDTSRFALKSNLANYDRDKLQIENKTPDTSGLVEKTNYKTKFTKIERKIPSINGLATNSALTTVESKIPNISSLVKKTDYDTKITEIEKKLTDHNHGKYITTPEFRTLDADVFNVRLAQANLITETDFDPKVSSLNRKITANKSKHFFVKNELKKLKIFDSSYFRGESHFEEDGAQN